MRTKIDCVACATKCSVNSVDEPEFCPFCGEKIILDFSDELDEDDDEDSEF